MYPNAFQGDLEDSHTYAASMLVEAHTRGLLVRLTSGEGKTREQQGIPVWNLDPGDYSNARVAGSVYDAPSGVRELYHTDKYFSHFLP